MEQSLTNKEIIALARFSINEVIEYSDLLEAFLFGKVITKKLIDNLEKYCQAIDDTIPYLRMYFSESLPPLRKARKCLTLLVQRKKELDGYPQLTALFQSNLDNINHFFSSFNLQLEVEALSNPPHETQRTLQQRIINPNVDDSPQTKNLVEKIVKTTTNTKLETCSEMSAIANQLKADYEKDSFQPNQEVIEASQLFLEGVSNLYHRDTDLKLARERATQLSDLADLELTPRQRKIKKLLAESSKNVLAESKNRGN